MPHIHKEIDWVTGYYLVHKNKVLLVYHIRLDHWTCPGGHIELNEDVEESLYREIQEEMGLGREDIEIEVPVERHCDCDGFKALPVPAHVSIYRANPTHRHIGLQYFIRAKTDKVRRDAQEHAAMHWFFQEELDDPQYNFMPGIQFYAKEALKKLGT